MKNTAVVFFTSCDGDKLQAEINSFFKKHAFTLMNVCYGCYYEPKEERAVHNAMVTYQYIVPVRDKAPLAEQELFVMMQGS